MLWCPRQQLTLADKELICQLLSLLQYHVQLCKQHLLTCAVISITFNIHTVWPQHWLCDEYHKFLMMKTDDRSLLDAHQVWLTLYYLPKRVILMQSWWSRRSPQPPLPLRSFCFLFVLVTVRVREFGYRCLLAYFSTCCTLEITVVDSQLAFLWWTPLQKVKLNHVRLRSVTQS